jgi:hypothetical protein
VAPNVQWPESVRSSRAYGPGAASGYMLQWSAMEDVFSSIRTAASLNHIRIVENIDDIFLRRLSARMLGSGGPCIGRHRADACPCQRLGGWIINSSAQQHSQPTGDEVAYLCIAVLGLTRGSAAKCVRRAPGDASTDRAVLPARARGTAVACRFADSAGASGYRHRLNHDGGAVVAPCWSGTCSPVALAITS